jgi:hypothetical protein
MTTHLVPPLPTYPEHLTPVFLTSVLQAANCVERAVVTACHIELLSDVTSFNAQLVRLYLTYDVAEPQAPQSLIAKLPTANSALHEHSALFRPGVKEHWFYQYGRLRTRLHIPHCYVTTIDQTIGTAFLLLEDLSPAQPGNQIAGVTIDHASLALHALADLHAGWWSDTALAQMPDLATLFTYSDAAEQFVEALYRQAWPQFVIHYRDTLPPEVYGLGERLCTQVASVGNLLDHTPRTLTHGDFRPENILFGTRDGQDVCWIIDWEDIGLGNGMDDVAWFLGSGVPIETPAQEQALLHIYYQALCAAGVTGYTWAQSYHDYRCAMVSAFVQGILTATPAEPCPEHRKQLAHVVGQRFIQAAQRLRLHELL